MPTSPLAVDAVSVAVDPIETKRSTSLSALYPVVAVLITVALAAMRLFWNGRFYFADDTQTGSVGMWREVGTMITSGQLRILDPGALTAGNYMAEGQWALMSPLQWLIGIGALTVDNLVVFVTVTKLIALAVMALGTYFLARSFGASELWALFAAVSAPAAGFTVYMDATSWVTGLFDAALFVWVWWGLRRLTSGRSPLLFLVATYFLVSFGYVFGVVMLAWLLVLSLVRAIARRSRPQVMRLLLASAYGGLLTIAIFLPGVLTANATVRGSAAIAQNWVLSADLTDLAGIVAPTADLSVRVFSGPLSTVPLMYISWALPLLILVWPATRSVWRSAPELFIFAAGVLALVLGPSAIGPMRWPVRLMPYVAIALILILAVALTRGFPRDVSAHRIGIAAGTTIVLTYLVWGQNPAQRSILVIGVVMTAALIVVYLLGRRELKRPGRGPRGWPATVFALAVTCALVPIQMHYARHTMMQTVAMPDRASAMETVLPDGVDDAFVVGARGLSWLHREDAFEEALIANLWYFSPTTVSNLYSVMRSADFSKDLCTDLRGQTCPEAFDTLVSEDPETGVDVATLLGVNTIVYMHDPEDVDLPAVPEGWRVLSQGEWTWVVTREQPVSRAGGVSATSPGTEISVVDQSDTALTLRVEALGGDPWATLSRIAWPGYTVTGAQFAAPARGYLLSLDLSHARVGDTVVVKFQPPGWILEVTAFVAALLLALIWAIALPLIRRRSSTGSVKGHNVHL